MAVLSAFTDVQEKLNAKPTCSNFDKIGAGGPWTYCTTTRLRHRIQTTEISMCSGTPSWWTHADQTSRLSNLASQPQQSARVNNSMLMTTWASEMLVRELKIRKFGSLQLLFLSGRITFLTQQAWHCALPQEWLLKLLDDMNLQRMFFLKMWDKGKLTC